MAHQSYYFLAKFHNVPTKCHDVVEVGPHAMNYIWLLVGEYIEQQKTKT